MNDGDRAGSMRKALEELLAFKTWEDYYDFAHRSMSRAMNLLHRRSPAGPLAVTTAAVMLHAMTLSLRDNPEEGDIVKVTGYAIDLLVGRSEEALGYRVGFVGFDKSEEYQGVSEETQQVGFVMDPPESIQ